MKSLIAVLAVLMLAVPAYAADGMVGKVTYSKGAVSLYQTGRSIATPMDKNDPVFPGDEIETDKNSAVTVNFEDGSSLSIGNSGKLTIEQYQMEGKTAKTVRLNVTGTSFEWLGAKNGAKNTEITTDSGTIALGGAHVIRGTKGAETTVYVQDGTATVKTSGGKADVAAGQGTTIAAKGAKPADAAPMNAEQIAWIRAELPAPATAWDAQAAAAPAPEAAVAPAPDAAAPVAEQQPAAPMEVPPVSAAPEAPVAAPVDAAVAAPVAPPVEVPVAAPVDAPLPVVPPVAQPVEQPIPQPAPVPGANPQAAVVTPAPAPLPVVPPLAP